MAISNNVFGVLDLETSTLEQNGEPIAVWLAYGVFTLYRVDSKRKIKCYKYREWVELKQAFEDVRATFGNKTTIVYVHNLSYDIDYIFKNVSRPKTMLSNSSHGIISAVLEDYPFIEFRCSYKLTGMSLAKIGKSLGFPKLDSSYRFILPQDDATPEEWEYCERDCDVVAKYILNVILPEFKFLRNIPLTKTGRVRKTFAKHYAETENKPLWDTLPPEDCYQAMQDAFAGGLCLCNPMYTGQVITDVDSYDIKSSYPFVMLTEAYPYTITREYEPSIEMLKERFWIAKLRFTNIKSRFAWGWLSDAKMNAVDALTAERYNGKLLNAGWIERTVTNVDYDMICKTYIFEKVEVLEFYHLRNYGALPSPYIETIKEYAVKKGELSKEVKKLSEDDPQYLEKNIEYMLSKNDFNGIYGMSVQKLVQTEYYLTDDFQYKATDPNYTQTSAHIKRNFLFGIFITAYARKNLLTAILHNSPHLLLYTDTDSIKYVSNGEFHGTNVRMLKKYRKYPALRNLGIFEHDAHYDKMVYWGAKKYAYEKHGKVYTTVAGLPKIKTGNLMFFRDDPDHLEELTTIEQFHPPMIFKDCKLGSKYIYLDHSFDSEDGFDVLNFKENLGVQEYLEKNNIHTSGGVGLYKVSYSLDITESDKEMILQCQNVLVDYLKAPINQNMSSHVSCKNLLNTN